MAQNKNVCTDAKKLKLDKDHEDGLKTNADFYPSVFQPKPKEDFCHNCEAYKSTNENLALKILLLEEKMEKLKGFVKDLAVETGRNPDDLDHLFTLATDQCTKNSAVQKALSTSVVLRRVFGYFDDPTVLKFRTVCKFWAEEASVLLLTFKEPITIDRVWGTEFPELQGPQIKISYNSEENAMGKPGIGTLKSLINLMTCGQKAGRRFPCSSFSLTCPILLDNFAPDAVELLEKFGYLIKSLDLQFDCSENSPITAKTTNHGIAESLRNLLFKWAPNLKYFFFNQNRWPPDASVSLLNQTSLTDLPNLEIFKCYDSWSTQRKQFHVDILKVASNLKKIQGDPCMAEVILAKKEGAIKDIQIVFGAPSVSSMHQLRLQSECCCRVEELRMYYYAHHALSEVPGGKIFMYLEDWESKVELLNRILYNNRNCLNKIYCQGFGLLSGCGLKIPVMPNLKSLQIKTEFEPYLINARNLGDDEVTRLFQIFPRGLDVASTFPNLAHISWIIENSKSFVYAVMALEVFLNMPFFEGVGPLTSVRSLSLTFYLGNTRNVEILEKIAACLPNVRILRVGYIEKLSKYRDSKAFFGDGTKSGFSDIFRIIWKNLQGLEEIHLFAHLADIPKEVLQKYSVAQYVDSAVTRLDFDTVKKLAVCTKVPKNPDNVGENSGEMPDTEEKDQFEAPSIVNMKRLRYLKIVVQSVNKFPILTHVAGTHGFGLLSNLIVVIEAEGDRGSVIKDPQGKMSANVKFHQLSKKHTLYPFIHDNFFF